MDVKIYGIIALYMHHEHVKERKIDGKLHEMEAKKKK